MSEILPPGSTIPFQTEWREAEVLKIVDGDTFDLQIDIGFDIHTVTRIRLAGTDAWEKRGEEKPLGEAATTRVKELMPVGSTVRIRSYKGGTRGKYGRWIADVAYPLAGGWCMLGETLIKEGHATPYGK